MSLPTAIRNVLLANTSLAAEVGTRVYYLRFPQDDVQPAVVFRPLANVNLATHGGTSSLLQPEVRLTLRAERLSTIETMRQAIVDQFNVPEVTMSGYGSVMAEISDLGAEYDDKLRVYHHFITLNLYLRTA